MHRATVVLLNSSSFVESQSHLFFLFVFLIDELR